MWMVIKRKLINAYKYICKNSIQFILSYLIISDLLALYIFINVEKMITDIDLSFNALIIFIIFTFANCIFVNIAEYVLSKDAY